MGWAKGDNGPGGLGCRVFKLIPSAQRFPASSVLAREGAGCGSPEIPVAPEVEHYVLDTSLDEVYFALQ